ncbi:MAG TPA: ABC transporter permease [Chitinophagaceae bacterium]|nr:ABC transporter permease [Chitinophagaceae bacterium]
MLKNYLTITLRNLRNNKVFSLINIVGLSTGIACFILLLLYTAYENSFDKFQKNAADIYRPYEWNRLTNDNTPIAYTDVYSPTYPSLGQALKQLVPDVVDYVNIQLPWGENLLRSGNRVYRVSVTYADPSFFSVFTFPLVHGNADNALHDPDDIVLTETRAMQVFGNTDAVGKTLEMQIGTTFRPFRVSAVAKDAPANSTIQFDVLGNYHFAEVNNNQFTIGNNWHPTVRQSYVLLKQGSTFARSPQKLSKFLQSFDPTFVANTKNFIEDMLKSGVNWNEKDLPISLKMQPLLAIHTGTSFNAWGFTDYGKINPMVMWVLLAIAAGILLIACINFTTLSVGRAAARSKEVGVRKVIGAGRGQVVLQFLVEAFVLAVISTCCGLLMATLLLPWFNMLASVNLHFSFAQFPKISIIMGAVVLAITLIAGGYPALVLSKFKPVTVLKSKIKVGGSNFFTKALVTFQFVLSIAFIVSTVIILQQTRYMMNKNPGFNKENVVAIDALQTDANMVFPLFKQAALKNPSVLGVASAAAGLGLGQDFLGYSDKGLSADINIIDTGYINVMGMQLIAGKNLPPRLFDDTIKPIIINETMMRAFGWNAGNAIGRQIKPFQGRIGLVTGVVKNFNYRPMTENIRNQVFETSADKGYGHFYVRIHAGNPAVAVNALRRAWNSVLPGIPMKYSFLDDDVNSYYSSEQKWSSIVGVAGAIAIVLASLGLLGLAALAAVNRTKEIGVRKVLGASVINIVKLISKDFLRLIVIAFVIASPIAWYAMYKWLQGYAYRITIGWWIFLAAGATAILLALATIGYHAVKAALANPVKSLRTE